MSDVITYLRNYDYSFCLAKGIVWVLDEAVDYLAAYLVNRSVWPSREAAYAEFNKIRGRLLSAVVQGIDDEELYIDVRYRENCTDKGEHGDQDIDLKKTTVQPYIFLSWALDRQIEMPEQFVKYVESKRTGRSSFFDSIGLKRSTVHHERCRAVAGVIWSREPELTIADMARRAEIVQFGCEGQEYDTRTICRWLSSLKKERKLGRPRRSEGVEEGCSHAKQANSR